MYFPAVERLRLERPRSGRFLFLRWLQLPGVLLQ